MAFPDPTDQRPLEGRSVVVCRPVDQATSLIERLETLGAAVVRLPLLEVVPPLDPAPLDRAVRRMAQFDWVCLTSSNGVAAVVAALRHQGLPWPDATALAVVGPATRAAAERAHLEVSFEPTEATARALAEELPLDDGGRISVLAPLAELAGPDLITGLADRGADIEVVTAYRSVMPDHPPETLAAAARADAVLVTSGSTVDRFVAAVGLENVPPFVVAIGPATAAVAAGHGLAVADIAEPHTEDGLIEAVVRSLSS